MTQPRISRGVSAGGQFAVSPRDEADTTLDGRPQEGACPDCVFEQHSDAPGSEELLLCDRHEDARHLPFASRWHSDKPLESLSLAAENRLATDLVRQVDDGIIALDAPYQRGSVWTEDQQIGLCKSLLMRIPVPAIVTNDRTSASWDSPTEARDATRPLMAVVDGKQRIEAVQAWFHGRLPLPASWFPSEEINTRRVAADGTEWVTFADLARRGQTRTENRFCIPVARGSLASVEEEAGLYLLLNGAGTPQTEDDMGNAARVAQN